MTTVFIVRILPPGGKDGGLLEVNKATTSLKEAKLLRDSYRAYGLDAKIIVNDITSIPLIEEDAQLWRR